VANICHERLNLLTLITGKEKIMPDTFKYTSVSVSKKAHENLTQVKLKLSQQHGIDLSIAKIIEKLALQEVRNDG
jgi:hypothetical protein